MRHLVYNVIYCVVPINFPLLTITFYTFVITTLVYNDIKYSVPFMTSTALLDDVFADRIISKTIWPPRSPALSPPDFFLWGAMRNSVYSNNPHTINELKMAITEYIRNVDRAIPNTVFENAVQRVNKCLEIGGGYFEHYL